jgi:hypothetical protein
MALVETRVFGNPHSINPTSAASTDLVKRARAHVLRFFAASAEEYVAIFTPNATAALRLVGEAYPFHPGDRFLLTFDNHNSVNGIREFARARGAETTYVPSVAPELRIEQAELARYLNDTVGDHHNLFAYPAQSNFSGVQHPLDWIEHAHPHGFAGSGSRWSGSDRWLLGAVSVSPAADGEGAGEREAGDAGADREVGPVGAVAGAVGGGWGCRQIGRSPRRHLVRPHNRTVVKMRSSAGPKRGLDRMNSERARTMIRA